MMRLRQIRYFLNLANTLNFTHAAELSRVSQPALTKAIQNLEDEFGGKLLVRDGRDTRLTELGRVIRGAFEKIIESEMRAKELANQVIEKKQAVLSIGLASTLGPEPVSGLISKFLSERVGIEILIDSVNQDVAAELVLSGALDACFCVDIEQTNSKLLSIPLYIEHLLVASATGHRFSTIKEIPVGELAHETYIDRIHCNFRKRVIDHFTDNEVLMNARLRSDREDWVQHAVAQGFGIAMVPEHTIINKKIELTPVRGMSLSRQIGLITTIGSSLSPVVHDFADAAKEYSWPSLEL